MKSFIQYKVGGGTEGDRGVGGGVGSGSSEILGAVLGMEVDEEGGTLNLDLKSKFQSS